MTQRCQRCVLPAHEPDVRLDDEGICNFCRQPPAPEQRPLLESDMVRLLERQRGRGPYDCMVMCSGGKDSVAALHFMVEHFRAKPLVYTFDNGFGSAEGRDNVERIVDALRLDWIYHRSTEMDAAFAEIIRSGAPVPICPVCSLWYTRHTLEQAKRYDIRLVVTGWTRGQISARQGGDGDDAQGFPSFADATREFLLALRRSHPAYKRFPLTMAEIRRKHRKIHMVSPHWYLRHEVDDYRALIKQRYGWKPVERSYPTGSVNCELNYVAAWLSDRHYGFNHHHIEESELIRRGEQGRDEALEALAVDIHTDPARSAVERVLSQLGLPPSTLERR
jgi:tRNA(Ile)-lysidine synthase TilS/MesJ